MKNFLLLLLIFPFCLLSQTSEVEEKKITALINYVETLPNASFIRNGKTYKAKDAANHLRRKRKSAGKRIKNVNNFIDGVATKSYFTGRYYYIKFSDGTRKKLCDCLYAKLKEIN